ncbi:MAG TPA: CPBP family intramembrane metalloprotease [Anaerolineae bacterium]|nr:CPBP family intramembrane metalloprotease [Anaerolineae bacterium]
MHKIGLVFWNKEQKRLRTFWRLLVFFCVYTLVTLLFAFLSTFILPANTPLHLTATVVEFLCVCLMLYVGGKLLDRRSFSDFGFHINRRWLKDFIFGLGLGALLIAAIFTTELSLGWIQIKGFFRSFPIGEIFTLSLFKTLPLFICIGFCEEMLMRGYLLRNLAEGCNLHQKHARTALLVAMLLSSVIFGILHAMNPNTSLVSTVNLSLNGIFLALGFLLTGELAIPIGLHITWNIFQGPVFGFPVSGIRTFPRMIEIQQSGPIVMTGGAFGPEAGFIGLAAIVIGSVMICVYSKKNYKGMKLEEHLAQYHSSRTETV